MMFGNYREIGLDLTKINDTKTGTSPFQFVSNFSEHLLQNLHSTAI